MPTVFGKSVDWSAIAAIAPIVAAFLGAPFIQQWMARKVDMRRVALKVCENPNRCLAPFGAASMVGFRVWRGPEFKEVADCAKIEDGYAVFAIPGSQVTSNVKIVAPGYEELPIDLNTGQPCFNDAAICREVVIVPKKQPPVENRGDRRNPQLTNPRVAQSFYGWAQGVPMDALRGAPPFRTHPIAILVDVDSRGRGVSSLLQFTGEWADGPTTLRETFYLTGSLRKGDNFVAAYKASGQHHRCAADFSGERHGSDGLRGWLDLKCWQSPRDAEGVESPSYKKTIPVEAHGPY